MRPRIGQTKSACPGCASVREAGSWPTLPPLLMPSSQGLRGRILSGSLQPGTSLPPERELAGQLAVSRATLREGLSILSQMGLLRSIAGVPVARSLPRRRRRPSPPASPCFSRPGRSPPASCASFGAHSRSKRPSSPPCAARARSWRRSPSRSMRTWPPRQDTAAQNLHGRAFHYAVARASGNPLLTETMTSLNDAFAACFHLAAHGTSARSGAAHPRSALADPRCHPPTGTNRVPGARCWRTSISCRTR